MHASQSKSLERVRDQRIARIAPLATPHRLLTELALTPQQEEVVICGPRAGVRGPRRRRRPAAGGGRAVQRARLQGRRRVRPAAGREGGGARRRPARGHARVLREAAHHHRLEGHDQRPAPGRLGRREHRPAAGAQAAAGGPGPRPAGRLRVPGPDHAAVHLGHRGLGRDRRPYRREPDPPPARLGAVDADRLQEPHGRQRAGGGRRGSRRGRCPRLRRGRRRGHPGDPAHARQPRRPRDPARRPRRPEPRARRGGAGAREAARRRPARAGCGGRVARQLRQGRRPPARGGGRDRAPGSRGTARHRRA